MAVYNTGSDAANTAVRSFLTKVGEYYLGHSFNTGSGKGSALWIEIRDVFFESCCAYCGEKAQVLQIEHVIMFNRAEFGLHHPGNTVPCCKTCNKRERNTDKTYCSWEQHLRMVCENRGEEHFFEARLLKIAENFERQDYPKLNENEQNAIRVIANSLYDNTKLEGEKSLNLYKDLDEAFVRINTEGKR